MRALLLLALLALLALPAVTQAAPYTPTLTGEQFVKIMRHPKPLDPNAYLQREKAYSYLDGARDSAEGRVWCDLNQLKTPDLAYGMADEIAKLPAADQKRSAATLLLHVLQRKYPCNQTRSRL